MDLTENIWTYIVKYMNIYFVNPRQIFERGCASIVTVISMESGTGQPLSKFVLDCHAHVLTKAARKVINISLHSPARC